MPRARSTVLGRAARELRAAGCEHGREHGLQRRGVAALGVGPSRDLGQHRAFARRIRQGDGVLGLPGGGLPDQSETLVQNLREPAVAHVEGGAQGAEVAGGGHRWRDHTVTGRNGGAARVGFGAACSERERLPDLQVRIDGDGWHETIPAHSAARFLRYGFHSPRMIPMNHLLSILAAAGAFSAGVAAQTASYTLFGEGCNGAAVTTPLSLNDNNPTLQVASLPNEYAYPVINTTGVALTIVGFEIFTTTNTANVETGNTGLIYDLSGPNATVHTRPDPVNCANGTITVAPVAGGAWWSTSVYPPITIQPGVAFWFHVDAYSRIAPPQHTTTGGVPGPVANWYRRPSNNMVWTSSVSVARQIFRLHCLPALPKVPALMNTGLPQFGQTLTLDLSGGQPFLPGFMITAFDRTQWLSFPTPVHLAMFGAPNCYNQTSSDIVSLVLLDGTGAGSSAFTIPNNPGLGGFTWHNQGAVLAPGVNSIDMLVTNAGTAVVGN